MGHNRNRNRLGLHPHIYRTGPNHLGPVHISPVAVHQPIPTGPIKDRLRPVAVGPRIGLDRSYDTKSILLTNFYFVLNKTNYTTPCEQVLTAVISFSMNKKRKYEERKKIYTPTVSRL
jgi:hypothetical protein